jgi:predicted NUDIX family NTP pyrophosphohydrolase
MISPRSAGVLFYRITAGHLELLLVHPGGPFWRHRDVGAWQIPKGQIEPGEDEEAAARREVREELGITIDGPLIPLGEIRQARGKIVIAFTIEHDFDPASVVSNTVEIDWPPRSGRKLTVPEIDEARWFSIADARRRMLTSQAPLIDRVAAVLNQAAQPRLIVSVPQSGAPIA